MRLLSIQSRLERALQKLAHFKTSFTAVSEANAALTETKRVEIDAIERNAFDSRIPSFVAATMRTEEDMRATVPIFLVVGQPIIPLDDGGQLALPSSVSRLFVDVGSEASLPFLSQRFKMPIVEYLDSVPGGNVGILVFDARTRESSSLPFVDDADTGIGAHWRTWRLPGCVSDATGFVRYRYFEDPACNSVAGPLPDAEACGELLNTRFRPSISLDELLSRIGTRHTVEWLKLTATANGRLLEMLKGAAKQLERVRNIVVQFPVIIEKSAWDAAKLDLRTAMEGIGFSPVVPSDHPYVFFTRDFAL